MYEIPGKKNISEDKWTTSGEQNSHIWRLSLDSLLHLKLNSFFFFFFFFSKVVRFGVNVHTDICLMSECHRTPNAKSKSKKLKSNNVERNKRNGRN